MSEKPDLKDLARIGRTHPELAERLKGRTEILSAVEEPPRRRDAHAHHILLNMFDHQRRQSIVAVIDAEQQKVVDVRRTKIQFQLSDREREEAERIAADDARVRAHLAGRSMNALTRLYFPTRGGTPENRHAIVFIRPSKSERWYAIVDLTAGTTVDVLSRRRLAGD
ncbi:MAG TPA: hypothetical protein VFT47_08655 [Vicinamibacterales bacterium]|nr:hypothetical protein [Vicinamibacterales bacterium]